jgi:hypothetical protein
MSALIKELKSIYEELHRVANSLVLLSTPFGPL